MTALRPAATLGDQRPAFEVDDGVAYFNTAGLSPLLRTVKAAGLHALDLRARPWSIGAAQWFTDVEELRSLVARLMGVLADDVALVPASSYGLAAVARNLTARQGDRVLVLSDEFASNHNTWQRFARRGLRKEDRREYERSEGGKQHSIREVGEHNFASG